MINFNDRKLTINKNGTFPPFSQKYLETGELWKVHLNNKEPTFSS